MSDITITKRAARNCYELALDGQKIGVLTYFFEDDSIVFTHTYIEPEFEGQGLASKLVRYALDEAVMMKKKIVPRCSYVASWIQRHQDYAQLVKY